MNAATIARLRRAAEDEFAEEIEAIAKADDRPRPPNWKLSPSAVVTYVMGGKLANGFEVSPKYVGDRRLIEIAVATLTTDRALLLLGSPGTAKSTVSEHISAGVCGTSRLIVQGTAGLAEEGVRYGWNYALLLAKGPSKDALVASPIMRAMQEGLIARVEELSRIPSDTQDSFITILSEKTLPVPEIDTEIPAARGFNLIATANDRDRGVNEMSSALKRRFNTVVLPAPSSVDEEVRIVEQRVASLGKSFDIPAPPPAAEQIRRIVTIFRELRDGKTLDGKEKVKQVSGTLSAAEAIGVVVGGMSLAAHFGDGTVTAADLASGLSGAIVKDPVQDRVAWKEYLETVVKGRSDWKDIYRAARELA